MKVKEILILHFFLSYVVCSMEASHRSALFSEKSMKQSDSIPVCFIDGSSISYNEMLKLREQTDSIRTYMYERGRESIQNFGEQARNGLFLLKSIK
ncbi:MULTISPECIES: hypothetical protein [Bacteroides]|uniref:hypothetical protein n=1 Tax=Bacteroides TaxID=816 RepID=UPI0004B8430C|nr:hypothetical protein [Bacteroides neonati]